MPQTSRFGFGRNWKTFVDEYLTRDRIETAKESLQEFYHTAIDGATFIDVGCGSGLFSLAAVELGATSVHSFDYDDESVQTARKVRDEYAPESDWRIEQGDILDDRYVANLGTFDCVYSWGVLHHTGNMWAAIENVFQLAHNDSEVYIALYNDDRENTPTSPQWEQIKRAYIHGGRIRREVMLFTYVAYWTILRLYCGENPVRKAREYDARGMTFWTNMRDWIGGYPYEYASVEEVRAFIENKTEFELSRVNPNGNTGCNEFLFTQ
jgi:cyclopropane fatty-acyl-phospholipid synthase-like methyltransferase